MEIDEIRRKHPKVFRQWQEQPEIICPPEGEMLCDARERVKAGLDQAAAQAKDRAPSPWCCPSRWPRWPQSLLTGCQLGDMWKLGESCGQWQAISVDNSGPDVTAEPR